jgi:hypothetical protein
VRRAAGVLAMALGLLVVPLGAAAQQPTGGSVATESSAGIPYVRVDDGDDDPYRPLLFEEAGQTLSPLDQQIVAAADADTAQLLFASAADLGGFQDATIGAELWRAAGVSLTGVAAPLVNEGDVLSSTTLNPGSTSTTVADVTAAIPVFGASSVGGVTGRSTFAFTDGAGRPVAPPDALPPLTNPPAPPSEGIDAGPATTTTIAPPAAPPGTTAPPAVEPSVSTTAAPTTAAPTTAAPATTTSTAAPTTAPSTTGSTTTTTTTTGPTTTTITTPTPTPTVPTTTTTRPPTTTTATSTTTTTAPTTTTVSPTTTTAPTTTTTVPPPSETFSLTQERPSATACVRASGGNQPCDALWNVPLAATGETFTLDVTLRNSGDVDASALQLWASAPCTTTSTATPAGTGDLCAAVELTIQRYTTSTRDVPLECVYGGGTAQVCSLSAARTLAHLSTTYPSAGQSRAIGTGLQDGEAAHLRLTLRLPDVDNRYQQRSASMSLTWRQVQ